MAWVTTLGPHMAQIDYRLRTDAGCSLSADRADQVAYRLDSDRCVEWIGAGLTQVDIQSGTAVDEAGQKAARMLADGRDPRTGAVLVAPKLAVDPRAKLPAGPLVDAVRQAAERAGVSPAQLLGDPRAVARFGRLQRGVLRQRVRVEGVGVDAETLTHRGPVRDLEKVAQAAGIGLDDVYDADQLATARVHSDARVMVGNRGYDLTLDLPKSYSVLLAMASPELACQLEDVYLEAVRETVAAVEGWAGYGMRGHHGDGQRGQRVEGSGLLGWMTVHRTARPVAGGAPDPHLHAHVTLLNVIRGVDGKWSTVGAGGRDIHRHAHAADALVKARLRQVTGQRWGMEWVRDERTGAWEVAAVPEQLRAVFSKRAGQIAAQLQHTGIDPQAASAEQSKVAAARSREAKQARAAGGDLRADWHRQAHAVGVDPDLLIAKAIPDQVTTESKTVTVEQVAAHIFRAEEGLTAHRKVVTRADVLAAVMDAAPGGIRDVVKAEQLTDAVLACEAVVALPPAGAVHLSNAARYTTTDILTAERGVLTDARDRFAGGYAIVARETVALAVAQFEVAAGFTLGVEQRAVLDRLATAGHGVDTVVGVAGAGKTTLMAALRASYAADGKTVAGAATAAVAAQNLQAEAGITSRTIASWLARIEAGPGLAGVDVLVIDEAAMVDDRHLARLLHAAGASGTKVVAIGDPKQLKAVGVGGTFAAVHDTIAGLELTDNRRQRDTIERAALAAWRNDQRRAALQTWADTGRMHVATTAEQAHTAMVATWASTRMAWTDPHERIDNVLMLAHTNADVTALNTAAQHQRRTAGELGTGHTYSLPDGGRITLYIGDQVITRTNDPDAGVLNGHRGVVTAVEATGGVRIQRRTLGADGPELVTAQVSTDYITGGGVQLAYAITAAKAQGLTTTQALVYGNGMDAHVLYAAMSRDRHRADLWLALEPMETDADRARLGEPATATDALHRAVDAYATRLEHDRPDCLVSTELDESLPPLAGVTADSSQRITSDPQTDQERAPTIPWQQRHYGHLTDKGLQESAAKATQSAADHERNAERLEHRCAVLLAAARQGAGPRMRSLREDHGYLSVAVGELQQAQRWQTVADDHAEQARQAYRANAGLEPQLRRNPVVLALRGTSRKTLNAQMDANRIAAETARQSET
ncbi:MAG: relaxase domain-containing protein, partial [Longispora sp.]|nr:relaxase domain-containing protein [Longispora sp. (in: high G+C Gram-positive bacteria)]